MAITASLVKELRERTGLGMMDCKKALVETEGDIEQAIDNLRKSGQAKAAKKAGRTAAEGTIRVVLADDLKKASIVEVNCETDFVGKGDILQGYADEIAGLVFGSGETDVEKLKELSLEDGKTVEEKRLTLVQEIGENIQIRRAVVVEATGGVIGNYIHSGKIGVLVALEGGDEALAKDIAMHVAGHSPAPVVVKPEEVPQELVDKEKEIFSAQAKESGKPEEIIEKMVTGRVKKYLSEISLTEQSFVKDPDTKVGALAKSAGATIEAFIRYEVGEGIEKEEVDFAEEVMAQVKG